METDIRIFTDGACKGNPGPGGWAAVCADFRDGTVRELCGSAAGTTNNAMEVMAALRAVEWLRSRQKGFRAEILSDSTYVIRGVLSWLESWKARSWKTKEGSTVINLEIWKALDQALAKAGGRIAWRHIPAHSGIPGNERADLLSAEAALGAQAPLYSGPIRGYSVDISSVWVKASPTAAWYISWVDGKLERHKTWADCERRVKGRGGAKFKKITSVEEEKQILASWGAVQL